MDVTLELGRYEFRAKLEGYGTVRLLAEVYISENGLKFSDGIKYNTFTEDKIKNIVIDPITVMGRTISNERVLSYIANSKNIIVANSRNEVRFNCGIEAECSPEDVVAMLLEQLMQLLQNSFPKEIKNLELLTIKVQYPIKYTPAMFKAYQDAFQFADLTVRKLNIDEDLLLQDEHRGKNILLLDIGYKFTRIYNLHIGEKLPFRHKIVNEHEFNYGGYQFDLLLFNHFVTEMNKSMVTSSEQMTIMKLCDKIKKELSKSTEATFRYEDFTINITRKYFERMIRCFVQTIFRKYRSMTLLTLNKVEYNFARGGCTLIPCINNKLKEYNIVII